MKKIILGIFASVIVAYSAPSLAGVPVYDEASSINFVRQFDQMLKDYEMLQSQLKEAQNMYKSVTGVRGFGDIMQNEHLRQFLPQDMKSVYDSVKQGGYSGLSGGLDEILKQEQFSGTTSDYQKYLEQREKNTAALNKKMGLDAYKGAEQRMKSIDGLMNNINRTQDAKGIAELQARISSEQTAVQNEITKLQMVSQLEKAEQGIIDEHKRELNRRILNPKNTGMPGIK